MTLSKLQQMKLSGQKIVCLTAYDAAFARCLDESGVDVVLVGDSLGMVVQGHNTTLPVTLEEMVYHTKMVQRGNKSAWCIADIPFMGDSSLEKTLCSATALMKEGLANMVKLEGGERVLSSVKALSALGIPVCGHLGLLPQSVNKTGYKIQGKGDKESQQLLEDSLLIQESGAEMLILECIPESLAEKISLALDIPVIGIGSGRKTDGQILVLHDILGITLGKAPKFSKNFMLNSSSIQEAIFNYVKAVKEQSFPSKKHVLAE